MQPGEYEIMYRVEETHWWYRALHDRILHYLNRHVPDWPRQTILDAGCGTGAILKQLGSSTAHIGVDLSTDALTFCAKRQLPNLVRADINRMPFASAAFDAVICSSVLYHQWVPQVNEAIAELARILKPGGCLLINVPAFASLHSEHDERVLTARRFTRSELIDSLSECGFEIVECVYWTSLLFPLIWAARRFSFVRHGRDFDEAPGQSASHALFDTVMKVESALSKGIRFPAGLSLFAVAKKRATGDSH